MLTGFTGKAALTSKRAGSYGITEKVISQVKTKSHKKKVSVMKYRKTIIFTELHNEQTITAEVSFHNLNINYCLFRENQMMIPRINAPATSIPMRMHIFFRDLCW